MDEYKPISTPTQSVITLTDDDIDSEKQFSITSKSSNDNENLSPNSSMDYCSDNFLTDNNRSFQIVNPNKSTQFVPNHISDSLYSSSDDEKSDQSQLDITVRDCNYNENYNETSYSKSQNNYFKLADQSASELNPHNYIRGGKYENFIAANKFSLMTDSNSVSINDYYIFQVFFLMTFSAN